jgi:hypothetical protein
VHVTEFSGNAPVLYRVRIAPSIYGCAKGNDENEEQPFFRALVVVASFPRVRNSEREPGIEERGDV